MAHKDPSIATQNLQIVCNSVDHWLASRKLFLNNAKLESVVFLRKLSVASDLAINLSGTTTLPSRNFSFLGLLLDANLKWADHLDAKCISAKRALLGINGRVRRAFGFDSRQLRFLYSSVIEPIITYGCLVWLSAINRKLGIRKLRSFHRSFDYALVQNSSNSNAIPMHTSPRQYSCRRFLRYRLL